MKKLLIFVLVIGCYNVHAQDSLNYYNNNREQIKKTGMEVLGGWAVANLAVATPIAYHTTGSTKYFYQMSAIWNIGNLLAAASGYLSADNNMGKPATPSETLRQQRKIEGIFLINGGLDVVYMGTGIYLNHRGNRDNSEKLTGYGSAIVLQGAFLLLFDSSMFLAERNNGRKLFHFLQNNPITFDGKRVGMIITL